MENKETNTGIDYPVILAIVFTVLKLTKVIDWSWWWVLSPIWITFLLIVILIIITIMFFK